MNRLNEWLFYGSCDPSLGKAGASRDPSALLVGGFNRHTGILDVVEARIRKRVPDRIISDIIELQREYACLVWAIETVQFQEFLRTELVKRSAIAGVPVPARAVQPHTDKLLRIESLQPHMANGLIRLHPSQNTLIDQLRHFLKPITMMGRMPCICSGHWRCRVPAILILPAFRAVAIAVVAGSVLEVGNGTNPRPVWSPD
ncbi:phage terminase large subunit [Serratia ureilytica]